MTSLSVFGNVHLGYVVIETEKFADWRRFGRDAIGMHLDDSLADTVRFRLDDNECRFLLRRGPAEDVTALGWQLDDHDTFDEIVARVTRHGVPITEGTAEEAALRGVERLVRFPGPNGLAQEIFTRARPAAATAARWLPAAASSPVRRGMGHVAITSKKPHQMRGYYNTVFDARLSDFIDETISGVKFKIRFLRVNERHHSVAIAAVNRLPINPIRTRVQHVNVQVADLDDMTGVLSTGQGTRLRHGTGRRAAHQRQGAVLLRDDAVRLRMGGRLESDRRRREHLGANHVPGHQHLGPHPGGADHHRQARPVQDRRPVVAAPRGHGPRARRAPASPTTDQGGIHAAHRHPSTRDPARLPESVAEGGDRRGRRPRSARLEPRDGAADDGRTRHRDRHPVGVDPGHHVSA